MARAATLALLLVLFACARQRSKELDRCRAAEEQLAVDPANAHWAIETCEIAYRRTGASQALLVRVRAQLMIGELDAVVDAARNAHGWNAARFWHLAGEAEFERHRPDEAQRWYERALTSHRLRDPKRAANVAGRLADVHAAANVMDEAIHYQHMSRTLAKAAGDRGLNVLTTLGLVGFLLDVGDVRTARATLDTIEISSESPFYREYHLCAGELELKAGRRGAAAASFSICIASTDVRDDPATQLRCRLDRAALAIERGDPPEQVRAELELATTHLTRTESQYGHDPDRVAEVEWLRARLALAHGDATKAVEAMSSIDGASLGAAMRSRIAYTRGRAEAARGQLALAEDQYRIAVEAIEKARDGAHYRETRRSLPHELRDPYEALFVLKAAADDARGAVELMERALSRDFVDQLAASVFASSDNPDDRIATAERRARALRVLDNRRVPAIDLAGASTPIIAFFKAEGDLWRTAATGERVTITKVAPLSTLAPLIRAVSEDPDAEESVGLSDLLLPEVVLGKPETPLVIIPDAFLEGVRFSALRRKGRYLIEDHPVVLAPTFAIARRAPAPSASEPSVVLGDPDGSLPEARAEATSVAHALGAAPQLGPQADRRALLAARRARVLHVASHGSRTQEGTMISLADGPFDSADVLEAGIAPDLVVVASCSTAASRPDALWTSIAAAFLAGGSRFVVGATGSIPDKVARAIVVDMFDVDTHDPSRAVTHALRMAIKRGVPARSWSAFVLFGVRPTT